MFRGALEKLVVDPDVARRRVVRVQPHRDRLSRVAVHQAAYLLRQVHLVPRRRLLRLAPVCFDRFL